MSHGFMWVRSLGRALLGGFGLGSVMYFIQVVAGAESAGHFSLSSGLSAWAMNSVWQLQGS